MPITKSLATKIYGIISCVMDGENYQTGLQQELELARATVERSRVVMESLAGFCHALGQPATVLLSSVELLKMPETDAETRTQILDVCYDAALEIRSLLTEMKKKREYVSELYLAGKEEAGSIISLQEWHDKQPPKASWDK